MTKIIIDIPVINCEIRALKPDIQIPMPNTDAVNNHIYALNIGSEKQVCKLWFVDFAAISTL